MAMRRRPLVSEGKEESAQSAQAAPTTASPAGADTAPAPRLVRSVLRACAILDLFTPERPKWTLTDLARASGLSKTTVHRLIGTLEAAGMLVHRDGTYRPSMVLFRIGSLASEAFDLRREARPVLQALASEFGDTMYLVAPDGEGRAVCLERIDGDEPVKIMVLDVGKALPLDRGAASTVLLAFREEDLMPQVAAARGLEPDEFDDPKLRLRVEKIRRQRYSAIFDELTPGAAAVGAPIFDAEGTAVAAISLGGPKQHFAGPRLDRIIEAVTAAAASISRRLGN